MKFNLSTHKKLLLLYILLILFPVVVHGILDKSLFCCKSYKITNWHYSLLHKIGSCNNALRTELPDLSTIQTMKLNSPNYELADGKSHENRNDGLKSFGEYWQIPWGKTPLIRRMAPVYSALTDRFLVTARGGAEQGPEAAYSLTTATPTEQHFPMLTDSWGLQGPQGVFTSDGAELLSGLSSALPAFSRSFTVLQFNMLAHCYASSKIFPFAPKDLLKSQERWENTVHEILQYQADVICLQEVDRIEELNVQMTKAGYKGVFIQKGGGRQDGVAIFYKADAISLVQASHVNYGPEHQDGVGLFAVLQPKGSSVPICLATTHLYWHPRCEEIRLCQTEIFLASLKRFVEQVEAEIGTDSLPVVLTGDFNTRPGAKAYRFIQEGELLYGHKDFSHAFGAFRSAYSFYAQTFPAQVTGRDERETRVRWGERLQNDQALGEPAFTSCTEVFASTLDYIWYLEDRLRLLELLELPSFQHAAQERGLPSVFYPSDHISLMARFDLGTL